MVKHMLRTQVYLPHSQVRTLKEVATDEGVSMSEVLRRLVNEKFIEREKTMKKHRKKVHTLDRLLALAKKFEKMGVKGPPDLATNMDEYLYGGKK